MFSTETQNNLSVGTHSWCLPAIEAVQQLLIYQSRCLISIDGRCGSGKTYLADVLSKTFNARVLHMDDFYLPVKLRTSDWLETPGGNIDLNRLWLEAVTPTLEGKDILYRAYDCHSGCYSEPQLLADTPVTILEGTYSQLERLSEAADLRLFLTLAPDIQARRLALREGPRYDTFVSTWIPLEEQYFNRERTAEKSHLVIDTSWNLL